MLLAVAEPPECFRFRLAWSTFRRRHQAVAKACHIRRRGCQQAPSLEPPSIRHLEVSELALTDERWEAIVSLLPPQKPQIGRPNHDHRQIVAGMLWIARTGSAWRALPEEFGPWETVRSRYDRWRKAGIWQQILDVFKQESVAHAGQVSL